jgi:hypothetical protein
MNELTTSGVCEEVKPKGGARYNTRTIHKKLNSMD